MEEYYEKDYDFFVDLRNAFNLFFSYCFCVSSSD